MRNLILIAIGLTLLGACSSQTVNFDYDREADFSSYETYAWYEGENTLANAEKLQSAAAKMFENYPPSGS